MEFFPQPRPKKKEVGRGTVMDFFVCWNGTFLPTNHRNKNPMDVTLCKTKIVGDRVLYFLRLGVTRCQALVRERPI